MWATIGRFLGVQAAQQLAVRLPYAWGFLLTLGVMVVVNLAPVLTLLGGSWGVHDVVLFYAIENMLLVLTGTVRLLTLRAEPTNFASGLDLIKRPWATGNQFAALFCLMFFGTFTLVGTILAAVGSAMNGLQGSALSWIVNGVLLVAGHVFALVFVWFGQGQRTRVTRSWPIICTLIPRVAALHAFAIGLAFYPAKDGVPLLVWIMVGFKLLWDFGFMIADLVLDLRRRRVSPT